MRRGGSSSEIGGLELRFEWYGEVVPQRINDYDDCFVECLGMPAPLLCISGNVCARRVDRRYGTLGLVIKY